MQSKRRLRACEPDEDEILEQDAELEYGGASTNVEARTVKLTTLSITEICVEELEEFFCPKCQRHLLDIDRASRGLVVVVCRKCKRHIGIQMTGKRLPVVGFL